MRVAALIVGLALAGCSSMKLAPDAEPPANYRELVLQRARTHFSNPESIRDAQIAPPARSSGPVLISTGAPTEVWVVCVRANAQSFFGYNSLSDTAFVIHNGQVVDVYESAVRAPTCKSETFEPFPELMQPA
jgi:hypothetical protein